jgi:hypothetical protein
MIRHGVINDGERAGGFEHSIGFGLQSGDRILDLLGPVDRNCTLRPLGS